MKQIEIKDIIDLYQLNNQEKRKLIVSLIIQVLMDDSSYTKESLLNDIFEKI